MRPLDENWRRHLGRSLMGRLRLALFAEITGSGDTRPDPHEVRLFLMRKRRSRTLVGDLYDTLFHLDSSRQLAWEDVEAPADFTRVLHGLERRPHRETVFIELGGCPAPWPDILGVLIRCERLAAGGYVYSLMYLDERLFQDRTALGYAEVRARREDPEVFVSVLSDGAWIHHTDVSSDRHADLAAPLLTFLSEHGRFRAVGELAAGAGVDVGFDGKDDPHFMELVTGVFLGAVRCSELSVPLDRVKPHDPPFALRFPQEFTRPALAEVRAGNRLPMVVYWLGDRFVMSDDYPVYMAYRQRGEERVPVVVLGDYPQEFGPALRTGGPELLPDVMVDPEPPDLDEETMDLVLETRLRSKSTPRGPVELYALHARLCRLLEDRNLPERRIHDFLARFPLVLDAYGASVRSEVRLGSRYRVDLVLQYPTADRRILLVELEAPSRNLFTRAGRTRAPITHALQQVEDWLRWWMENPAEIPGGLARGVRPDGLVVAGRSLTLSEDEKQRLVHLNQNRSVKLITYDDLLDRLEEMIRNLETT